MIQRYSDHAANERIFLAWIRTAIAIMAFGFLVERFDLFLQIAGGSIGGRAFSPHAQIFGNIAGLILIALGGLMMLLAAISFRKTALDIGSVDVRPGTGTKMDLVLAGLLILLGASLYVYLSYTAISRM